MLNAYRTTKIKDRRITESMHMCEDTQANTFHTHFCSVSCQTRCYYFPETYYSCNAIVIIGIVRS